MTASDSYWVIVQEVWDAISIHDGEEVFIRQFKRVSEVQKVLFASHWAQSEIMNGGLGQFFSNSTGVLAPEAKEAFMDLDMPKTAGVLGEAMMFFGSTYPRDKKVREDKFESFWHEHGEDAIPMLDLEDAMADLIEQENGGFCVAANMYGNKSSQ